RAVATDIAGLACQLRRQRGEQERVDRILDIGEVAQLVAAPYLERPALDDGAQPDADEGLPRVGYPHPRTVGVGQAQRRAAQAIDALIEQVEGLGRRLVDAVDVDRT